MEERRDGQTGKAISRYNSGNCLEVEGRVRYMYRWLQAEELGRYYR
jgi:hypothetical protein